MPNQNKLILPNPEGYVDETARFRKVYYFGNKPMSEVVQFDSWSNEQTRLVCPGSDFTGNYVNNGFSFVPTSIIQNQKNRDSVVILDCLVPQNPLIEDPDNQTEKQKYFSFKGAKILSTSMVFVDTNTNNNSYSKNTLVLTRLILLVPLGFKGVFLHSPIPKLDPEFRILSVGSWDPKTAKDRNVLSPVIEILSIK